MSKEAWLQAKDVYKQGGTEGVIEHVRALRVKQPPLKAASHSITSLGEEMGLFIHRALFGDKEWLEQVLIPKVAQILSVFG